MVKRVIVWSVLSLCLGAFSLVAQSAAPGASTARQEPCWQKAGVEKPVALQLASIEREAHSQIEEVDSNPSLTAQQKHRQVLEIRQRAFQKIDGMITPDQRTRLMECRQARGLDHPGVMGPTGVSQH